MERFQFDIMAFRHGTSGLSANAKMVYLTVLEEMYLAEGPIPNNLRRIAGIADLSWQAARGALDQLLAAGKLVLEDGKLSNERAAFEIAKVHEWRSKRGVGGKRGGRPKKLASQPDLTGISGSSQPHLGDIPPNDHADTVEMPNKKSNENSGSENLDGFPNIRLGKVSNGSLRDPPVPNGTGANGTLFGDIDPPKPKTQNRAKDLSFELGKKILSRNQGATVAAIFKTKGSWDRTYAALVAAQDAADPDRYCRGVINARKADEDWEAKVASGDAM